MFMSMQRGVTMVEAAVVVVMLGMLAAFAVPRYAGLRSQARMEALNALTGNIRSAANMGHGVWLASGNVSPVVIDGKKITIVNGYPDAAGIRALTEESGFAVAVAQSAATFTPKGARTPAGCNLKYVEAPSFGAPFTLTYPQSVGRIEALRQSC